MTTVAMDPHAAAAAASKGKRRRCAKEDEEEEEEVAEKVAETNEETAAGDKRRAAQRKGERRGGGGGAAGLRRPLQEDGPADVSSPSSSSPARPPRRATRLDGGEDAGAAPAPPADASARREDEKALAAESTFISTDEAELYDRQIRLWGMAAQQRMSKSKILVVGVRALSNEVVKNIVLAGVGAVTLLDPEAVTHRDYGAQFLLPADAVGKNRAEAVADRARSLNPRVTVNVDKQSIMDKDEQFLANFDLAFVTECDFDTMVRVDEMCRKHNVKFFATDCHGFFGFIFADLQHHEYIEVIKHNDPRAPKDSEPRETRKKKEETYVSLAVASTKTFAGVKRKALPSPVYATFNALWKFQSHAKRMPSTAEQQDPARLFEMAKDWLKEKHIDESYLDEEFVNFFAQNIGVELSAVCAIVGGFAAQEILRTLSGVGMPLNNTFAFNGVDFTGLLYRADPTSDAAKPVAVADEVVNID